MTTYREKDEEIVREYTLEIEEIFRKETENAFVEIVPLKEYGRSLFIDGQLQFTEKDEYIYHEALVHPCLATIEPRHSVCIIGGGDGLAAREVLRWGDAIHSIDIIDWDKEITDLFTEKYSDLNNESLQDSKVHIENENIRELLHDDRLYDCIIIDLLDPNPFEEGQTDLWYDVLFIARNWIKNGGSIVINAGGITPWDTEVVDWLVDLVQKKIKWNLSLYKVFVPSFGREWCFILLTQSERPYVEHLPDDVRFITKQAWKQMYSYGWTKDYRQNLYLNLEDQLPGEDE
jgi:spermidine synthase